jgi:hypothetical protein
MEIISNNLFLLNQMHELESYYLKVSVRLVPLIELSKKRKKVSDEL